MRIRKQSLPYRCGMDVNDVTFDWIDGLTNNALRILKFRNFAQGSV